MQGVTVDPAALIVAVSGLVTTFFGIKRWSSGRRNEREQQQVANELARKAQDHDVYRDMVNDLRTEITRKDSEIERLQADRHELQKDYTADMGHLRSIIDTLRVTVHSEIAKSLASDGMDAADIGIEHAKPEDG